MCLYMDNYSDFFIDFAKNCSKTQKKSFKKSEIITTYIAKRNQFCLLLSGEANLIVWFSTTTPSSVCEY